LNYPYGVAIDASGNAYIADTLNNRIRMVATNGIITTVAGNGSEGNVGDGGAAINAELYYPEGVVVDTFGNLFIADYYNNRIRKVGTNGIITTVAGNGIEGFLGDSSAAINAEFDGPRGIAVDALGDLFVADFYNQCVRKVGTNGIITTVAGNGTLGYSGDGGAATNAELAYPIGVAVDVSGNLFIADWQNGRVREVQPSGIINTVAGGGNNGLRDGGAATNAEVLPDAMAVDASGNLFIADEVNNRIRKVTFQGAILALNNVGAANAGSYDVVISSPYGSVTSSIVTLELPPPPVIQSTKQSGGLFTFTWTMITNQMYQIETTTSLSPPNWTNLGVAFTATTSTMTNSASIGTNKQHFYRVVLLP
jgi:sugar lactone lactonase YvrE